MYCISGGGLDTFCNCLDLFLNHASHTFRIRSGHAAKLDLRRDHIGRVAAMDAPQGEYCHLHRVHPAGDDLLHHHDHLGGSQHGVRCILRLRAMSPSAGDGEVEQVHGSCYGPDVEPNLSCPVGVRQHMHSIDRVHMGVFQHAFFHRQGGVVPSLYFLRIPAEGNVVFQQEGAAKRREAEAQLGRIEGELKQKLLELRG